MLAKSSPIAYSRARTHDACMSTNLHDAATLREWVRELNLAIASGTRSVTLGGQTVIYNTTESLIKARNDLWAQLNALERQQTDRKASRQSYAYHNGREYR